MAFSFFFRDYQIRDLAVNHVIESLRRQKINIWDADARWDRNPTHSRSLRERMGRFGFKNLKVDATISISAISSVTSSQAGHILTGIEADTSRDIRELLQALRKGGHFEIEYNIRSRVSFRRHDLLKLEQRQHYSLILCKNVLLHFSPDERIR